jgi:hypothetical protein
MRLKQQRYVARVTEFEKRLEEQQQREMEKQRVAGGGMLAAKLPGARRSTSPFRIPLASPREAEDWSSLVFPSPRTSLSLNRDAECETARPRMPASPRPTSSSSLQRHLRASSSSRATLSPLSSASEGVGSSVRGRRDDADAHLGGTAQSDELECADPALYEARQHELHSPLLTLSSPALHNKLTHVPKSPSASLPAYLRHARPSSDASSVRSSLGGSAMWLELGRDMDSPRYDEWGVGGGEREAGKVRGIVESQNACDQFEYESHFQAYEGTLC